jgi:hypothetical protein
VKANGGLGFSITGGTDDCATEGDSSIYVSAIIDGGTADQDGRLQIGDKVISLLLFEHYLKYLSCS